MPRKDKAKKAKPMPAPAREAWQVEAQIVRDVAEAIERIIRDMPKGGSLELAWQAMEACKVDRDLFDRAIWVLRTQGRVRVIKDRLYPPARERH